LVAGVVIVAGIVVVVAAVDEAVTVGCSSSHFGPTLPPEHNMLNDNFTLQEILKK
jgi:hypothetical protein